MKRLLISTTALSMALMQINPAALMAQTMTEDGSVIADDGTVLCLGTAEQPCDLKKVMRQLKKAEKEAAAAEEGATQDDTATDGETAAERKARRQAEKEAAAAEAAAAEAEAQRQADEAAAAHAEADAAAKAEEQRQADEAAAAAAEQQKADEAAALAEQLKAEEAAKAEEQRQADEAAAAEQQKADEAAALAEQLKAEEAAKAEEQRQADEAAAAEQQKADEAAAADQPAAEDPAATEQDQLAEPAEEPAAEDGTIADAATALPEDQVEPPPATEEAVQSLSTLLAAPETGAPAALDAANLAAAPKPAKGQKLVLPQAKGAKVRVQKITKDTARSSAQDFKTTAKAGTAVTEKKGLTDLEKVGLVALGALVVGAIINNANASAPDQVVSNTGDRVVVRRGTGDYVIYKDDDTLLRRPGSTVRTETFQDGSTRTIVERADGTQVVTIRDVTGRVLRRATYDRLGREVILIDDLAPERPLDVTTLPQPSARVISMSTSEDDALLKARMAALDAREIGRTFSLRQIREIKEVRNLAATVDVNNITFDTGSAAIKPTQAESLASLGRFLAQMVRDNPNEVFLIEGHTDAVGSAASNLALSDRRAESVALALTEYFDVPPENMVVQGYGESDLRIQTEGDERQNRRVAVRIITPLLDTATASLQ